MRDYAAEIPVSLDYDLKQSGWNGAISPYPGMDPRQKAFQSLRQSILKKFQDRPSGEADANALQLFLEVNESCRSYNPGAFGMSEIEAIALGEAKEFLYRFFFCQDQTTEMYSVTWPKVFAQIALGNGANIGSPGTDFLSKVGLSSMSATSEVVHKLFRAAISSDPLWSSVESTRHEFRGSDIVRGSRLSFVPKKTDISRTICTEPVCNMLLQKGIGACLERLLASSIGIDLAIQPDKNRELARLGSKFGLFGTIDLSSASDSMSLSLVRNFFPKYIYDMLMVTRSPCTTLPGGAEVELHMISSMGNAFTFPLQTIFFSALVYGAYRAYDIPIMNPFGRNLGNFAVFGDDIIVVSEAYDLVSRLLYLTGFKVNVDKSFNTGLFRESCGHDYYDGHNVRGVYIQTLRNVSDRYSAINRLNRWSAVWRTPLPLLIHTLLKGTRLLRVPLDEQDDAGIKVPLSELAKLRLDANGSVCYRYLSRFNRSANVSDVESSPPRMRGWFNNHHAVLLAALAGTLRSSKVVFRSNEHYQGRVRVRRSPRWDYVPPEYAAMRASGDDWKVIFALNLNFFKV